MVSPGGDYQAGGPLSRPRPDVWRADRKMSCPGCGYQFDAFGHEGDGEPQRPENGDYTICMDCGQVLRFVVGVLGFSIRSATDEETAEFHHRNPTVMPRLQRLWESEGR